MTAINHHINAIRITFEELFKGRFLVYFIPGIVVTAIYLLQKWMALTVEDTIHLNDTKAWYDFILNFINWGVELIFGVFYFFLDQIYIFIVLTALSPFNTYLGQKLENRLTGNKTESGFSRFIKDIFRMILVTIIIVIIELLIFSFYSLIAYISGTPEAVNTLIHFIIKAFFFGFAFYDFSLERANKGVFSTIEFAFSKPIAMLIIGSIFLGIFAIPYLGVILAPVLCVMISAVAYLYYSKALPKIKNLSLNE